MVRPCDLCRETDASFLLECDRLDGPLVQCRRCGLIYVGERREDFTFAAADEEKSRALAARVRALGLVDEAIETAEAPWRERLFSDRLDRLRRHVERGSLLEVGCASGEFLRLAARAGFQVCGVEPDPQTSARARKLYGLHVITGTLAEAKLPPNAFDAAVLFHVLEHLDSPRQTIAELHRLLKPGGILAIETPNIDTIWFRWLGRRWRQFIPDHYYFFTPRTLSHLLQDVGFRPVEIRRVGKPMSLRLFLDRLRRLSPRWSRWLGSWARRLHLEERTVYVNLGDIMLAFAVKES